MAQEISEKTIKPLPENTTLVRPFDKVTVYSTGLAKNDKGISFIKEGEPMHEHPLLAKKLIEAGKATEKAPADVEKESSKAKDKK